MIRPPNLDSTVGKVAIPRLRVGGVHAWEIAHRFVVAAYKLEGMKQGLTRVFRHWRKVVLHDLIVAGTVPEFMNTSRSAVPPAHDCTRWRGGDMCEAGEKEQTER
jgi:hypothetical protein